MKPEKRWNSSPEKTRWAGLVLCACLLVSCSPDSENRSTVYDREMTGLKIPHIWENDRWRAALPEGWVPEPVFGMRSASFRIPGENGQEAEVSLSRLPIRGGTLAGNINRWRKQAGLDALEERDVTRNLKTTRISGHRAWQMNFRPDQATFPAISGVILETEKERIFIKLSGAVGVVEAQQDAWREFLKNLEMKH